MSTKNSARQAALAVVLLSLAGGLAIAGDRAVDLGSYEWTNIRPTVPFDPAIWSPRAGLQAVELKNDLYVMGGRGPFSLEGETAIYGDVWKSADLGASWTKTREWQEGQTGDNPESPVPGRMRSPAARRALPAGCT